MGHLDATPAVEICTDIDTAAERAAAGIDVVVILPEGSPFGDGAAGPGRMALLVGDAADEAVVAAAVDMGAELFRA